MDAKGLNIALQGGGSHGAYSWGVLDRLLEEEDIVPDGVSGASAGAMNAIVLAHGYRSGGRAGARAALMCAVSCGPVAGTTVATSSSTNWLSSVYWAGTRFS